MPVSSERTAVIKDCMVLLRPWQWTKNLFVLLPLFFSLQIADLPALLKVIKALVLVCMLAGAVYIFNDYHDRAEDRLHPLKKNRPLASGRLQPALALALGGVLLALSLLFAWHADVKICYLFLLYVLMNVFYTLRLKHLAVIDIMTIATGFVIRIFIGGVAAGVKVYPWIIILTFLLSLFLAFGKRRDDLLPNREGGPARKSIDGYSLIFIDSGMLLTAAVTIVAYILYSMSPEVTTKFHSRNLYLTSFFVVAGILRYLQAVLVEGKEADPSMVVIKDHFIQIAVLGWLLSFGILIYI